MKKFIMFMACACLCADEEANIQPVGTDVEMEISCEDPCADGVMGAEDDAVVVVVEEDESAEMEDADVSDEEMQEIVAEDIIDDIEADALVAEEVAVVAEEAEEVESAL